MLLPHLQAAQGCPWQFIFTRAGSIQIFVGHTLCWTLAIRWEEKIQTDFVFWEKKIKELFAITLDECYDKVNRASLESNFNTCIRIFYLDK